MNYFLSKEESNFYEDEGYLVRENQFSINEVNALRHALERAVNKAQEKEQRDLEDFLLEESLKEYEQQQARLPADEESPQTRGGAASQSGGAAAQEESPEEMDDFWLPSTPPLPKIDLVQQILSSANITLDTDIETVLTTVIDNAKINPSKGDNEEPFRSSLNWDFFHRKGHEMLNGELRPYLKDGFCSSILLQIWDPDVSQKRVEEQKREQVSILLIRHNEAIPSKKEDLISTTKQKTITRWSTIWDRLDDDDAAADPVGFRYESSSLRKLCAENPTRIILQAAYNRLRTGPHRDGKLFNEYFSYENGHIIQALMENDMFRQLGCNYLRLKILAEHLRTQALPEGNESVNMAADILAGTVSAWINCVVSISMLSISSDRKPSQPLEFATAVVQNSCPQNFEELMARGRKLLEIHSK